MNSQLPQDSVPTRRLDDDWLARRAMSGMPLAVPPDATHPFINAVTIGLQIALIVAVALLLRSLLS